MTLEDLAVKTQENTDRSIRNEGRINKLEEGNNALHTLATDFAVMDLQLKLINENIEALKKKIENLEAKPGKRWESIVDKIVWAVIAAAWGFILAHVGISA